MTDSEITLSVLREIRDSIRTTNTRLDALTTEVRTGFEQTSVRAGLGERTLKELTDQIVMIAKYLKNRTEVEVQDLRTRVAKLEAKVG